MDEIPNAVIQEGGLQQHIAGFLGQQQEVAIKFCVV